MHDYQIILQNLILTKKKKKERNSMNNNNYTKPVKENNQK